MSDMQSAPPASAALAISAMLVTLGESFIITGFFAALFMALVVSSRTLGSCPNASAPCFTLGQERFIS